MHYYINVRRTHSGLTSDSKYLLTCWEEEAESAAILLTAQADQNTQEPQLFWHEDLNRASAGFASEVPAQYEVTCFTEIKETDIQTLSAFIPHRDIEKLQLREPLKTIAKQVSDAVSENEAMRAIGHQF